MVTPLLALWTVLAVQAPDSATRARYAAALHAFSDSIGAVQAATTAFRLDLAAASPDLVLARAGRLSRRCAGARRATNDLAALLARTGYSARTHAAEGRARRDLAEVARVLTRCEREFEVASPVANPDTLKAWGPFRVSRLETDLRHYADRVRAFQVGAGIR